MNQEALVPARPEPAAKPERVDPVKLELVRNGLVGLVTEMADHLVRAAYSPMAAEMKDFSIGLLDAEGRAIAQAPGGVPMFCADLSSAMKKGLALFDEEGIQPGDVILSNDTQTNGQHVSNAVIYAPIFADDVLVGFAAARSRWIDVGGIGVGSSSVHARDIFSEGIQLPYVKVYRGGAPDRGVMRIVQANTRFPELVMGDMHAQIGACKVGEKRFLELLARHGGEAVMGCVHRMWDEAETVARRAVEAMPDGVYEAACRLDNDGVVLDQTIPLKLRVTIAGSVMTIDFSEMSPQVAGPYNSRACETVARVGFKYLTTAHLPTNEGAFRNLKVICPEGTILSADRMAPMASFNMVAVSVIDLILRALQPALPDYVGAGNADNILIANMTGTDPRSRRLFQTFMPYLGGWGARARSDGANALVSLVQGDVRFTPVEVQEAMAPIRVKSFGLRPDSGGPGAYRGGLGIVLEREVLSPCAYHGRYERTQDAPWGAAGGQPGKTTRAVIRRKNGAEADAPLKCENLPLQQGDVECVSTAGGGGYGAAWQRDPERVRSDILNGYVSVDAAREDYGVVVDPATLELNAAATNKRREDLRAKLG
jgi:N-methylhydantoinase B